MLFSVTYCQMRRVLREGACPVLEVTVSYPVLRGEGDENGELSASTVRFNEGYREMAEKLMEWAEDVPYKAALADFAAMGPSALYRFDRRMLTCAIEMAMPAGHDVLDTESEPLEMTVTRNLRLHSRRGETQEKAVSAIDLWRWPGLTLCRKQKRRK